jgi:hypothetical protein
MGDIKFYSPVDFDDTSSGVTIEGELNANDAAYFYHSTQTENLRIKGSVIAGSRNNQTSYANSINLGTNSMDIKARSNIFQLINGVNKLTVSENYIVLDENTSIAAGALPAARLHVRGSGITSATSSLIVQNSATTELFRVRDDGNVGIGTTSPSQKLHVFNAGYPQMALQSNGGTWQVGVSTGNDLAFRRGTSGSNYPLWLDSSDNVGIGTTGPSQRLHVDGNARITGAIYDSNNDPGTSGQVLSSTATGTDWVNQGDVVAGSAERTEILVKNLEGSALSKGDPIYIIGSVGASGRLEVGLADAGNSSKMPCAGLLSQDLAINGEGYATVTGKLKNLITSPIDGATPSVNDTIYVKSGGGLTLTKPTGVSNLIQNVGQIGRVSTSADGNIVVSAILRTNDIPNLTTGKIWVGDSNTVESTVVHLDETNGRMGIGTNSPVSNLHVKTSVDNNVAQGLVIERSANSDRGYINYNGGGFQFRSTVGDPIVFGETDSEHLRILPDGNVGIGTTSPDSKLHIADSSAIITLQDNNSTGNTSTSRIDFKDNGTFGTIGQIGFLATDDIEIKNNHTGNILLTGGNVGIGTTSPGVKLDVAGQIRASSGLEISGGNINLVDNSRIRLGSSADFQIYHDGSNSYITDTGTGDLYIRGSNSVYIGNSAGTKTYISGTDGGATKLYYNGAGAQQKLETTTTGVSVTGTATATTFLGDLNGTINTATTAVTKANATNDTTVATTAFVQNLIGTIPAGLVFQGTWDAATNTPTLTSGSGTTGHFYIVSTDGSTNLDGITDWKVGDWAVFVEQGATDAWEKVDNSSVLDGSGTGQKVALWSGSGTSNTLTDAPITVSGSNATFAGSVTSSNFIISDGTDNYIQFDLNGKNSHFTNQSKSFIFSGQGASGDYLAGTLNFQSRSSVDRDINFITGATPAKRLTISGSGNVGIGTASPSSKLHVQGTSFFFDQAIFDDKVGIGTTSPGAKLDVNGITRVSGDFAGTGQNPLIQLYNTDTSLGANQILGTIDFHQSDPSGGGAGVVSRIRSINDSSFKGEASLTFHTGEANVSFQERMRITSSGNVGIGTTSPNEKLTIVGDDTKAKLELLVTGNTGESQIHFGDTDDVNSGRIAYNHTSDYMSFYTNNIGDRMIINSAGNVGIGTASPANLLQVNSPETTSASDAYINVFSGHQASGGSDTTGEAGVLFRHYTGTQYFRAGGVVSGREGNYSVTSLADSYLRFETAANNGNAERMRITSAGNVGIGTASPSQKLHVVGKGLFTDDIQLTQTSTRIDYGNTTTAGSLRFWSTNAGGEKMRITSAGNVGIGTTNPESTSQLHIYKGTAAAKITLETTDSYESLLNFSAATNEYSVGFNKADNTFRISNANSLSSNVRMAINNAGNVGIGTTNPTAKLHSVTTTAGDSALKLQKGTSSEFDFQCGIAGVTGDALVIKDTTLSYDYLTLRSGNVGIGTTSPDTPLHVVTNTSGYALTIEENSGTEAFQIGVDSVGSLDFFNTKAAASHLSLVDNGNTLITGGGNVGIGTTNPLYKLDVASGSSSSAFGLSLSGTARLKMYADGTYNYYTAQSGQSHRFTTSGGADFLISNGGNVGIGTTNPGTKLQVDGIIRSKGTSANIDVDSLYGAFRFNNGTTFTGGFYNDAVLSSGNAVDLVTYIASGDYYISTASTPKAVTVKQGGNVGIGTTNPSTLLDLYSTGAAFPSTTGTSQSAGHRLRLGRTDGAVLDIGSNGGSGLWLQSTNGANLALTYPLLLNPNGGNVGIGTTSPGAQLHIGSPEATPGGTAGTVDRFIVQPYSNTGGPYIFKARTVSGSEDYLDLYYGSNQIISYGLNGNVGIGTTSPDYKLDVEGSVNGDVEARIYNSFDDNNASSTPRAGLWLEAASNNGYLRVHGAPADTVSKHQVDLGSSAGGSFLTFTLGVTERMRITNSGNIGIGTTNPSERLSIAPSTNTSAEIGYAHVGYMGHNTYAGFSHVSTNTTTGYALLQASSGETYINAPTGQNINFRINNSTHMVLDSGGNIGIGTTSPSRELDVAGDAKVSGQTHTGTLRVDATAAGPTPAPNQSPSDAIVRPAGDTAIYLSEPEEWLEININGVDYVIPAYL